MCYYFVTKQALCNFALSDLAFLAMPMQSHFIKAIIKSIYILVLKHACLYVKKAIWMQYVTATVSGLHAACKGSIQERLKQCHPEGDARSYICPPSTKWI